VADEKIFVEQRPVERDYAVRRPGSERASAVTSTQAEAINRASEIAPNARVLVERVRKTSVGRPDKWRKP
jgi:pyridoxine/pyridoxamine 5'-phosphate oxidase